MILDPNPQSLVGQLKPGLLTPCKFASLMVLKVNGVSIFAEAERNLGVIPGWLQTP